MRPLLLPVALAAGLAGCIADGAYAVRGRVRVLDRPVEAAVVRVRPERSNDGVTRRTGADGGFACEYGYGGAFPFVSDGAPRIEVEAEGFAPVSFPLRGELPPGVERRDCGARPACFELDVVLRPAGDRPR